MIETTTLRPISDEAKASIEGAFRECLKVPYFLRQTILEKGCRAAPEHVLDELAGMQLKGSYSRTERGAGELRLLTETGEPVLILRSAGVPHAWTRRH